MSSDKRKTLTTLQKAAPALLRALDELASHVELILNQEGQEEIDGNPILKSLDKAYSKAIAAIKKAKGRL